MDKVDVALIPVKAKDMSLEELIKVYGEFQLVVNNTPNHLPDFSREFQLGLHAALGLSTEANEVVDAYKKRMYGKMKPLDVNNIREEAGDIFYYLHALIAAYGFDLKDIIRENVIKLRDRYLEKFEN